MSGAPVSPEATLREALAPLDRRGFLKLAGAAAAVGRRPTGCGGQPAWLRPATDIPLAVLSERGYAVFTAATMRIVGPAGERAIRAGAIVPGRTADAWLTGLPELGATLGSALLALEYACFPLLPKLRPFTRLDPGAQDAVLHDLMVSGIDLKRDLFKGVKSLACLSFYADPASRPLVSYPGPLGGGHAALLQEAMTYDPDGAGG